MHYWHAHASYAYSLKYISEVHRYKVNDKKKRILFFPLYFGDWRMRHFQGKIVGSWIKFLEESRTWEPTSGHGLFQIWSIRKMFKYEETLFSHAWHIINDQGHTDAHALYIGRPGRIPLHLAGCTTVEYPILSYSCSVSHGRAQTVSRSTPLWSVHDKMRGFLCPNLFIEMETTTAGHLLNWLLGESMSLQHSTIFCEYERIWICTWSRRNWF